MLKVLRRAKFLQQPRTANCLWDQLDKPGQVLPSPHKCYFAKGNARRARLHLARRLAVLCLGASHQKLPWCPGLSSQRQPAGGTHCDHRLAPACFIFLPANLSLWSRFHFFPYFLAACCYHFPHGAPSVNAVLGIPRIHSMSSWSNPPCLFLCFVGVPIFNGQPVGTMLSAYSLVSFVSFFQKFLLQVFPGCWRQSLHYV